jgi:starch synthase
VEPASTYPDLGLPPEWYGALEWVFPEWARRHALDKGEAVNFLKGAVVTADRIVTVSQVKCLYFLVFVSCCSVPVLFLSPN